MKIQILISTLILISLQTKADDDFAKLYKFAEDIRDIVTPPMKDYPFELDKTKSDHVASLIKLDELINIKVETQSDKVDCETNKKPSVVIQDLEKRIKVRDFTLSAVMFANSAKNEQNALGRFMSDEYINFMGNLYSKGNTKAYDIYTVDSLIVKYKAENPDKNLDALNISERESLLNAFAEKYLGEKLPPGLLMKEMTFQDMVANSANWEKTLLDARSKLTNSQYIELVSKFGGNFGNRYNYARANAGLKVHGIVVDTPELLDSVKNGVPGGICRDVALSQVKMLSLGGFKKSYVVAYKTLGVYHATVITEDPETGKIIKFNYDETTVAEKGTGTTALIQDSSMPDHGLNYRIYDSNGSPVVKVSSELNEMLKNSAGGESSRSFNSKNYSLNKVNFNNGSIAGSLFTGKTSSGEILTGVSVYNEQVTDNSKTSMGLSVSNLSGDRSLVHMSQQNLYFRTSAELSSPSISLGPVKSNVFGGVDSEILLSRNSETRLDTKNVKTADKPQLDGNLDFYAGVQNKFESDDKKISIDNKVYVNFYPDIDHIAQINRPALGIESAVIRTGVTGQLTDTTKALLDTAVVMRTYGTNIAIKAILDDEKRGMQYSVSGTAPVTKDMPSFLPGAESRATASVAKKTKSGMTFSLEVGKTKKATDVSVQAEGKF